VSDRKCNGNDAFIVGGYILSAQEALSQVVYLSCGELTDEKDALDNARVTENGTLMIDTPNRQYEISRS
jgi:hypothetical protein